MKQQREVIVKLTIERSRRRRRHADRRPKSIAQIALEGTQYAFRARDELHALMREEAEANARAEGEARQSDGSDSTSR